MLAKLFLAWVALTASEGEGKRRKLLSAAAMLSDEPAVRKQVVFATLKRHVEDRKAAREDKVRYAVHRLQTGLLHVCFLAWLEAMPESFGGGSGGAGAGAGARRRSRHECGSERGAARGDGDARGAQDCRHGRGGGAQFTRGGRRCGRCAQGCHAARRGRCCRGSRRRRCGVAAARGERGESAATPRRQFALRGNGARDCQSRPGRELLAA